MTPELLEERFRELCRVVLPMAGSGATPNRHRAIFAAGREDLSLAKLVEAHWDAVAILEEAQVQPAAGEVYAVWASEVPGRPLAVDNDTVSGGIVSGKKEFCSGAALVDRALVTAGALLLELDLRAEPRRLQMDESGWHTEAFRMTRTAALTFDRYPVAAVIGREHWYTHRRGFWAGACGPAAAWAGGAAGLAEYALHAKRDDAHTLAHVAAMDADVWAMQSLLATAGDALDRTPRADAMVCALQLRHGIEQLCTGVLRRFARALGPAALAKDAGIARRYIELDLFLRQCHGERDLESLGRALRSPRA